MPPSSFHHLIGQYFNGGWLNRKDGIISSFAKQWVLKKNAQKVITALSKVSVPATTNDPQEIFIDGYSGKNPLVLELQKFLSPYQDDLIAALVHGSIATGEEIGYSDFDGLLIIRDRVFDDKDRLIRLAAGISESMRIMYKIDPLQHHGWFVLVERNLMEYPGDFLPWEVLKSSKTLLPSSGINLRISPSTKHEYYSPVKNLCRRIRRMNQERNRPKTMYQLKSFLSEFMMLPVLYLQAKEQKGISKKVSFEMARHDFNESVWKIMDEVSEFRSMWPDLRAVNDYTNFRKIGYIWMLYRKRKGPGIPEPFRSRLNDDFYRRMAVLANQVEVNLFQ